MSRESPPTERVTRLLDVLVRHPNERFAVSELARRAEISKPTCIGIARALTDANYLDRDPTTKTYGLGPALITAGRAAIEGMAPIAVINNELTTLGEQLHLPATASAHRDGYLTIIGRAGPPSIYDPLIQVGIRLPLIPPTGKMGIIFANSEQVHRWLENEPKSDRPVDRERLWQVIAEAQQAGYLVSKSSEESSFLTILLERLNGRGISDDVAAVVSELASNVDDEEYLQEHLKPGHSYPVSTVSAPSYDANGNVKLVFVVYVASSSMRYSDIHSYGEAVRAVGERVTKAIGGFRPWS